MKIDSDQYEMTQNLFYNDLKALSVIIIDLISYPKKDQFGQFKRG